MRNIQKEENIVKYPQREYAAAFMAKGGAPFHSAIIGITYPYPDYYMSSEIRSFDVFEYVLSGEGEILLDGVWRTASEGDVYILRSGEPHEYRANPDNPWKKIWINYTSEYMSHLLTAYGVKSGIYKSTACAPLFEELFSFAEGGEGSPLANLRISELMNRIAYRIAEWRLESRGVESRIRAELDGAVYKQISLDELSEKMHMSPSNLIRVFKKKYSVTPYEYLIGQKISAAKLLLSDTEMTVREIAERLCISDEHYFSNLFLSRTGMRPREYRAKKQ